MARAHPATNSVYVLINASAHLDHTFTEPKQPDLPVFEAARSLDITVHQPLPLVINRSPTSGMATVVSAAARFQLVFFVPPSALVACKAAIFAAGAGRYPGPGHYTECCWTAMGTGQFRPGDTANPHIGSVGALEEVQEVRVETLCLGEEVARKAVEALKM